jgi:hypothetical protein
VKVKLRLDDPETRAVWAAVQRAKAEVASWPAWKRGEEEQRETPRMEGGAVKNVKIGNIEFERLGGQLCIRKTATPRVWPDRTLNTLVIEPSELADLRVLLDAVEEQQPPESNEPDNQAARTVGLMIDAWRRLVG